MRINKRLSSIFFFTLLVSSIFLSIIVTNAPSVFAATIFSDSFESNDLSAWTGTTGGPPTVQSTVKASGSYAMLAVASQYVNDRVYKTLDTPYSEGYYQFKVYFNSLPSDGDYIVFGFLADASGNSIARLSLYREGATYNLRIEDSANSQTYSYVWSGFSAQTWYTLELYVSVNGATGALTLEKDGDAVITQTNIDTDIGSSANIGELVLGIHSNSYVASDINVYYDDAIFSTTHVGVASPYYPYIQQVSNVDSVADVGTHSNFTAQQYGPDLINDTLTEATTLYNSTLINEGFEGTWIPTSWSETTNSAWNRDNSQKHGGTYSAGYEYASGMTVGDLFTPTLNLTGAIALYISFYYFDDDCDANELTYDYYDSGGNWDNVADLGSSTEDTFNNRINVKVTDAQYLHGAFQLRIDAAGTALSSGENFYVDDFTIIAEYNNFTLSLEEQFTEVPYDSGNVAKLCVATGPFSGSENLDVEVWDGEEWQLVIDNLVANQWNNQTVTEYVDSANLYIRFHDGTVTSDNTQDTWQFDAVYLWIYTSSGSWVNATLSASSTMSDSGLSGKWRNSALISSVGLTDALSKSFGRSVTLTINSTITDSINQGLSVGKSLTSASNIVGGNAVNKALYNLMIGNVTTVDSIQQLKAFLKSLDSSVALIGLSNVNVALLFTNTGSVAVIDSSAFQKALTSNLIDGVQIIELANSGKALLISNNGILGIVDVSTILKAVGVSNLDSLAADSLLSVLKGIDFNIVDLYAVDSIGIPGGFSAMKELLIANDGIVNIVPLLSSNKALIIFGSGEIYLVDLASFLKEVKIALIGSIPIGMSIGVLKEVQAILVEVTQADVISLGDEINAAKTLLKGNSEGLAIIAISNSSKALIILPDGSMYIISDYSSFLKELFLQLQSSGNFGDIATANKSIFEKLQEAVLSAASNINDRVQALWNTVIDITNASDQDMLILGVMLGAMFIGVIGVVVILVYRRENTDSE